MSAADNIWQRTDAMWEPDPTRGPQINVIAADIEPAVARNVALYYAQKHEVWADAMARRLRSAARGADNDNRAVRKRRAA